MTRRRWSVGWANAVERPVRWFNRCLISPRDLDECVTYLRFPEVHHRRIPTTNRLERLDGESRQRTKVIPRFLTERSSLSSLYASLITTSMQWCASPMTASSHGEQVQQLRAAIGSDVDEAVA